MMSLLRQDTAEERISGLEVISKEFMKTEKQRDQRLKKKKKKKTEYPRTVGQLQKGVTYIDIGI